MGMPREGGPLLYWNRGNARFKRTVKKKTFLNVLGKKSRGEWKRHLKETGKKNDGGHCTNQFPQQERGCTSGERAETLALHWCTWRERFTIKGFYKGHGETSETFPYLKMTALISRSQSNARARKKVEGGGNLLSTSAHEKHLLKTFNGSRTREKGRGWGREEGGELAWGVWIAQGGDYDFLTEGLTITYRKTN